MEIVRTANAGVLLKLDGVKILLDGICGDLPPYLATPESIKGELSENLPDVVAFTHFHPDHFDKDFALFFEKKTGKKIISPENSESQSVGGVDIRAITTRHIGKTDIEHISLVISGSKTVWFMGDASPLALKNMTGFDKPDVLFAPFAYFNTPSALKNTKELGADKIFILHLPDEDNDELRICKTVQENIKNESNIHFINLGEAFCFNK